MPQKSLGSDRLTITLAPGQRESLMVIADNYGVGLAYLVRQALGRFIDEVSDSQLNLPLENIALQSSIKREIK